MDDIDPMSNSQMMDWIEFIERSLSISEKPGFAHFPIIIHIMQ